MDFANFEREKSYFKPYTTHLDFFVSLKKISASATRVEFWSYKVKIFCGIPIILFQCKSKGCNILFHLNHSLLNELNGTSWLKSDRLTFMLFLSETSISDNVVCAKTIQLSKAESDCIRSACSKQDSLSYQTIENLMAVIYEQDILNIWPVKLLNKPEDDNNYD